MIAAARASTMRHRAARGFAAAAAQAATGLTDWFMPVRRDWNAMGSPIPAWFRRRLATLDPNLALQYMPPRSVDPAGVDENRYPQGIWAICYRLGRTRWLAKQWVYGMVDDGGRYCPPDGRLVRLLAAAIRASRRHQRDKLARWFDQHLDALSKDRSDRARQARLVAIAEMMRRSGMTDARGPRVLVPG